MWTAKIDQTGHRSFCWFSPDMAHISFIFQNWFSLNAPVNGFIITDNAYIWSKIMQFG